MFAGVEIKLIGLAAAFSRIIYAIAFGNFIQLHSKRKNACAVNPICFDTKRNEHQRFKPTLGWSSFCRQAGLRASTQASLIPPIMSDMALSVHQWTTACTISVAQVAYLAWQTATTRHRAFQPIPVDGMAHTQSTLTRAMWRP